MSVDFTQKFYNFDGAVITDHGTRDGNPHLYDLTLSRVTCGALLGNVPGEPPADAEDHLKRFMLATHIKDNAKAELSSEELSLIKARIAKTYFNAAIVGQAVFMLDPEAVKASAHRPAKKAA